MPVSFCATVLKHRTLFKTFWVANAILMEGKDSEEIAREIGYSEEDIKEPKEKNVF